MASWSRRSDAHIGVIPSAELITAMVMISFTEPYDDWIGYGRDGDAWKA